MGEDPKGIPNNLTPYITQVAIGRREKVSIYGNDYPTPDGTGVRDYIHVMDLADGHVAALKTVAQSSGLHIYNLGTGKGTSVLEMIAAFSKAAGKPIPYAVCDRRPGISLSAGPAWIKRPAICSGVPSVLLMIWRRMPGAGSSRTRKVTQTDEIRKPVTPEDNHR